MAIIVHKQKKAHGGKVKGAAPGDAPNTGSPGFTPAPTRPVAPDVISAPRSAAQPQSFYGTGGGHNPSSINPGSKLESPMAANLRASVDDDGLLDRLQAQGSARGVISHVDLQSPQTRELTGQNVPTNPGTKGPSAGPKVPDKLG